MIDSANIILSATQSTDTSLVVLIVSSIFGLFGTTGFFTMMYKARQARQDKVLDAGIAKEAAEIEKLEELKEKLAASLDLNTKDKIKIAELTALVKFQDRQINIMVAQSIAENPEDKIKAWLSERDT